MNTTPIKRVPEWFAPLTLICMAGLSIEVATGLLLYLAPFSRFNQVGVILHTVFGLIWMVAFIWYAARHWWIRFRGNFNHVLLLGYIGTGLIVMCVISGVWLTAEALFAYRITYGWSNIHLWCGFGLIFAVVAHLAVIWNRRLDLAPSATKLRFVAVTIAAAALFLVGQSITTAMIGETALNNQFPQGYRFPFGEEKPFAPSLGHTESNGAYDPESLLGSKSCGRSGCHEQILAEWEPSAHRYASSDIVFQEVQKLMIKDIGAEATRYCAGCHDPVALFSGAKNTGASQLTSVGAEEGVSCISCHAIVQTDVRGNGDYTITQPDRYLGAYAEGALAREVSDFLIRAYPRKHKASFSRGLYKTAEYCAACHKQFIDEKVNKIGWAQLQNQYNNWRESRWNQEGNPKRTISCRECHMPLVESSDPAAGDISDYNRNAEDGTHRSHRFLAANQVMPLLLELPGAEEQVELTEKWLRGEIEVPEIAHKWKTGPVIRLDLAAPETVTPGQQVEVRLVLTNNKTGHGFPTGPLDMIRSWVEFTVRDESGNVIYETGKPDANGMLSADTLVYRADGIDRFGKDIDRHNLWDMIGVRFKRSLFAGMKDSELYSFICPELKGSVAGSGREDTARIGFSATKRPRWLTMTADLMYQKADAAFMDRLFGTEARLRTPATVISSKTVEIQVVDLNYPALAPNQTIDSGERAAPGQPKFE